MGSTPSPPSVPNPYDTASTQQQFNQQAGTESQAGSMVNQNNAFGSLNYTKTGTGPGGIPIYSATTTLSQPEQNIFNALTGAQGSAANQANQVMSGANYGSKNPSDVVGDMTSGLTGQLLNKETSYLNPFFSQQTQQLDTQLRNQGLSPGTPAYDRAMNNLQQSQNQSVTGYLAQAEPAAFQQSMASYALPMETAAGLEKLAPLATPNSSFVNAPTLNIQPPNFIGAQANANQMAQQVYQDQMQQQGNMMSGLFGIPTAILGGWAGSPAGGSALSSMFSLL